MGMMNVTKASFQADIKRKQAFFNRCKRRFKVANTTAEKQWLKAEASRIVTELKSCNKKWKTYGFGACTWITKGFTVTNFTAGTKNKTKNSRTSARKTTTRRTSMRTNRTRSNSRSRSRTRSSASRRSYAAW